MKPAIKRPPRGDGRVALLEAAIRVGARQGLRGLTIRSAAAEAGVSHGLVPSPAARPRTTVLGLLVGALLKSRKPAVFARIGQGPAAELDGAPTN